MAAILRCSQALTAIVALAACGLAGCAHRGTGRQVSASPPGPPTQAHVGTRWHVVAHEALPCTSPPPVDVVNDEKWFTDITATGPRDAWATGACYISGPMHSDEGADPAGVLVHWDGRRWSQVAVPHSSWYGSVAATSGDDVWVSGGAGRFAGPPIHWDGRRWSVPDGGDGGVQGLKYVAADARSGVWGIGRTLRRWDGRHWRSVNVPAGFELGKCEGKCLATGSYGDVWVGGDRGTDDDPAPAIAHYDGRRWSVIPVPKRQKFDRLKDIAVAGDDVWAILDNGGPTRWSGGHWRRLVIPGPTPFGVHSSTISEVVGDGRAGIWMIDDEDDVHILHWDGHRVTRLRLPGDGGLGSVARVPGTTAVWGIGGTDIEANAPMRG